ncbi:MAG: hypothetical protein ACRC10_03820 [Thermoguttaceae bacterium]
MSKSFDKVPFPSSTFEDQDTLALSSIGPSASSSVPSKTKAATEPTGEVAVDNPSRKKGKRGPLTRILLAFAILLALGVVALPFSQSFWAKYIPFGSLQIADNSSRDDNASDDVPLSTPDQTDQFDPTFAVFSEKYSENEDDFSSPGNNPPGFAELSNIDPINDDLDFPLNNEFDDLSADFPKLSLTEQTEGENVTDMIGFPEQNQTSQTPQNTQTADSNQTARHHQVNGSNQANNSASSLQTAGISNLANPQQGRDSANGVRSPYQQTSVTTPSGTAALEETAVLNQNGAETSGSPYSPIDNYGETTNPTDPYSANLTQSQGASSSQRAVSVPGSSSSPDLTSTFGSTSSPNSTVSPASTVGQSGPLSSRPPENHPVPNQQTNQQTNQQVNQQVPNQQVNPAHGSPYRQTNSVVNPAVAPNVQPFSQPIVVTNQQIAPAQSEQNWTGRNRDRHLPETTYPITESEQDISPYQPQQTVAMNIPAVHDERNIASTLTAPLSSTSSMSSTDPNVPNNGEGPNPYAPSRGRYQLRYARTRTNESGGMTLPNTHGQLWCEYDITPYTKAVGVVPGMVPEQTIVDWILRQTGEKNWHAEPFSILSANSETLYVYNTPEMQELVAEIVDRFVNPKTSADGFALRIVSLSGANWMTQGHSYLKPIRIDSPGVNGWLLEKEDQARLLAELTRRSDYKELCSPQYSVTNGRPQIVSASVPKNYIRDAQTNGEVWPGYGTESSVINEGYNVTFVPLSGIDEVSADMMIRCEILQVERFNPVVVNVPSQIAPRQRVSIDAPQMSSFQLDEQIRWPKDKVLLLDLGTIPLPSAAGPSDAGKLIPEISRRIAGNSTNRGNVLIFVECRKQ